MTSIDTTHDDALREVPFAKEDIYNGQNSARGKVEGHLPQRGAKRRARSSFTRARRRSCLCLKTATRCSCVSTA